MMMAEADLWEIGKQVPGMMLILAMGWIFIRYINERDKRHIETMKQNAEMYKAAMEIIKQNTAVNGEVKQCLHQVLTAINRESVMGHFLRKNKET